jgi:hypothetical protein
VPLPATTPTTETPEIPKKLAFSEKLLEKPTNPRPHKKEGLKTTAPPRLSSLLIGILVLILIISGGFFYYKTSQAKKNIKNEASPENLVWAKPVTPVPWTVRDSQTEYVWNDRLFILGGLNANEAKTGPGRVVYEKALYFNDVWYTDDGENWVQAKEHAAFPPIRSASIISFKGKLWMLGGFSPDPQIDKSFSYLLL